MVFEKQKDSPTRGLSEYIASARYEDIPEELREDVKIYILDSLGCSIGGSLLKPGKIILNFFEGLDGSRNLQFMLPGREFLASMQHMSILLYAICLIWMIP